MATQLRLLENQPGENPGVDASEVPPATGARSGQRSTSPTRRGRGHVGMVRNTSGPTPAIRPAAPGRVREPLDPGTRERGLRGVAAARQALRDANRRVAIRDAERRRAKQAELVELAGRARVIASTSDTTAPRTPHLPDGNAAA